MQKGVVFLLLGFLASVQRSHAQDTIPEEEVKYYIMEPGDSIYKEE